jgi:3-oxoacyl-[acyl-carrier protein] reductase
LVEAVTTRLGGIDILINNAGMTQVRGDVPAGPLQGMTEAGWDYGIDINLKTAFLMTRAVLPGMVSRRYGRIVQMSSVTGPVVGIAGSSVYAAAKAGMLGMTRALAIEVGPFGVTVNCVGPGWIKTGSSSEAEIVAGRHTPVGRPGTPEEVGHVAVFLASEEASYVTGQMIVVGWGQYGAGVQGGGLMTSGGLEIEAYCSHQHGPPVAMVPLRRSIEKSHSASPLARFNAQLTSPARLTTQPSPRHTSSVGADFSESKILPADSPVSVR